MTAMRTLTERKARLVAAAALLIAAAGVALPAAAAQGSQPDLTAVRQATARFHSVPNAEKAGYTRFLECMDDGMSKGMGQHYVRMDLLADNGALTATTPEALVYDESSGSPRLVAVEYVVPGAPTDPAPHLLGQTFTYNTMLGVWKLHYWIWRANPDGIFKDYSSAVPLCSGAMAMHH
ncbi:MAG TPA: hypothetical protein VFX00_13885 [Pedococcus sp.]|nr:hypothetical protein [Pedococcus sp.]